MKIPYVNIQKQYRTEKKQLLKEIDNVLNSGNWVGGSEIEKKALGGNENSFKLPQPLINEDSFNFSFSGIFLLKSSILPSEKTRFLSDTFPFLVFITYSILLKEFIIV